MNIMVFNVPAETVGALSILNDFYYEVKKSKDYSINWIFVLSKPNLEETKNIQVLNFPWIKKSWFHRIYFDHMIAPKLIKKFNVDKILSFQNVIIPHTKVEQILYMHNSLPFVDYKFSFKDNRHLWIYQNIIGRNIINSIKKAKKVIVQAEWIKKACAKKSGVSEDKIHVETPKINVDINKYFETSEEAFRTFFYPASEYEYKNHKLIIDACKKLQDKGVNNYKVIFTLKGNENDYATEIYRMSKENKLPIEFVGSLAREDVFKMYIKSILIFPSYIETYGLPMLEAKLHKGIVLASDCPFSHEILDGYENAYFFNPFDENMLIEKMNNILNNKVKHVNKHPMTKEELNHDIGWDKLIEDLITKQGGE